MHLSTHGADSSEVHTGVRQLTAYLLTTRKLVETTAILTLVMSDITVSASVCVTHL